MIYEDIQRAIDTGAIIEVDYTKSDGTSAIYRLCNVSHLYTNKIEKSLIKAFCLIRKKELNLDIDRIHHVTFCGSPEAKAKQSVLINPTNVNMPYRFDPNKRIFALYGEDYN